MKNIKNYLLIFILAVFALANIIYIVGISTSGAELTKLENEEELLVAQNQNYKEQIMGMSSLTEIEGRAQELGFIKPLDVVYIAGESAVTAKLP